MIMILNLNFVLKIKTILYTSSYKTPEAYLTFLKQSYKLINLNQPLFFKGRLYFVLVLKGYLPRYISLKDKKEVKQMKTISSRTKMMQFILAILYYNMAKHNYTLFSELVFLKNISFFFSHVI